VFFSFWILEDKNKDPDLLASKFQKPKKHLFRYFLAYKPKPKSQEKAQTTD
jgi:hypothetical protein